MRIDLNKENNTCQILAQIQIGLKTTLILLK